MWNPASKWDHCDPWWSLVPPHAVECWRSFLQHIQVITLEKSVENSLGRKAGFQHRKGWFYSSRNEDPTINNGDFITLHLGLTHQHVVIWCDLTIQTWRIYVNFSNPWDNKTRTFSNLGISIVKAWVKSMGYQWTQTCAQCLLLLKSWDARNPGEKSYNVCVSCVSFAGISETYQMKCPTKTKGQYSLTLLW